LVGDTTSVLLSRARDGDPQALGRLLERHISRLQAFVARRISPGLRRQESSQDLVQSILREALRDFPRAAPPNPNAFRAWLFVAADRKLKGRLRFWRRERRDPARERELSPRESGTRERGLAGNDPTPSRDAAAREGLRRLVSAFATLPPEWREVILLARVQGWSHAQIAARLGRSEVATRSLLSRALARLSTELERGD
jgi:RNA polymerase sigma-70 factor (ECF subfamily)